MIKYKYFFGSDERSLNFLNTIYTKYNKVKVVTLEPKKTGRGRKITSNPVQIYCEQNDIELFLNLIVVALFEVVFFMRDEVEFFFEVLIS